jgi:SAM-dependent methyltransferase
LLYIFRGSDVLEQTTGILRDLLMIYSVASSHAAHNNYEAKLYQNAGNPSLVNLLEKRCGLILDVGCGAGDNSKLILTANNEAQIYGITLSSAEALLAQQSMKNCWIADIEHDIPKDILGMKFDALVFSHVLEHVRNPSEVLARYVTLLKEDGQVLIAVPNILSWRYRTQFMLGRFEYESVGTLDETHLRFFTYDSVDRLLLHLTSDLKIVSKTAEGSVPLWLLRRYIFPSCVSGWIDKFGCRLFPNLFGTQILIKAVKRISTR